MTARRDLALNFSIYPARDTVRIEGNDKWFRSELVAPAKHNRLGIRRCVYQLRSTADCLDATLVGGSNRASGSPIICYLPCIEP